MVDEYVFKLSPSKAKLLIDVLGGLPAKEVGLVFADIVNQAVEQEQKQQEKEAKNKKVIEELPKK